MCPNGTFTVATIGYLSNPQNDQIVNDDWHCSIHNPTRRNDAIESVSSQRSVIIIIRYIIRYIHYDTSIHGPSPTRRDVDNDNSIIAISFRITSHPCSHQCLLTVRSTTHFALGTTIRASHQVLGNSGSSSTCLVCHLRFPH